jgi:uncharacterized membrane protein YqaE (UPF0057 family)
MGASDVLVLVFAVVLPPVAVVIRRGCGADLVINILLCLLGHIPGIIHAVWLVLRDRERRRAGVVRGNASGYGNAPAPQPRQMYFDTPAEQRNQAGFIPREEQGHYAAPQQQEGADDEKRPLMGDEKEGMKP